MPITVEIMTPERVLQQTEADSVVVPAADGELGILPHHAPVLAELVPGEIRFRKGDSLELLAVSGGYVEVRDNRISVFAETAEMAQEIDVERAKQAAEKAKAALRSPSADMNLEQIEAALRRALIRLRTVDSLRRRSGASHS